MPFCNYNVFVVIINFHQAVLVKYGWIVVQKTLALQLFSMLSVQETMATMLPRTAFCMEVHMLMWYVCIIIYTN